MIEIESIHKRYHMRTRDYNWKTGVTEFFGVRKKRYIQALDDVNLKINKGEIFGILGPNGAGKTTLLKIIAGFLLPEDGRATVNGYDIIKERRNVRLSVNFLRAGGWVIFEYKYPIDKLLEYWGVFMGLTRQEALQNIDRVLDIVGLAEKKKDFPENLSSGQRQKLNLARCILAPRPIYLLDEPNVNIDAPSANFIREYVKRELIKEGTTVLLATHNLWEAELMCDRVAILNNGKIIRIGTPQDLKKGVGKQALILKLESYSQALLQELEDLPYVSGVYEKIGDSSFSPSTHPEKYLYIYGDELRFKIPEIIEISRKYGKISYVNLIEPSFYEIFMRIVSEA